MVAADVINSIDMEGARRRQAALDKAAGQIRWHDSMYGHIRE